MSYPCPNNPGQHKQHKFGALHRVYNDKAVSMQGCKYCNAIQTVRWIDGKVDRNVINGDRINSSETRKSVLDSMKSQDIDSETGEVAPLEPDPGT